MDSDSAEERLRTITTLMERAALYRRALGPIMIWLGVVGAGAATAGWSTRVTDPAQFVYFWLGVSVAAASGAFLMARRQAVKEAGAFWTPPARRVVRALLPPLVVGGFLALLGAGSDTAWFVRILPSIWMWCYGCALHSASFFLARGVRWLGWAFILCGFAEGLISPRLEGHQSLQYGHLAMGIFFGGLHLVAGAYLQITESSRKGA